MRKLFYILLLAIATSCQGQIDIKDTSDYTVYVSDTVYSKHKNISNALESYFKVLKANRNAKVEIFLNGKVTASLDKDFFEGSNITDTIFITKNDTIIRTEIVQKTDTVYKEKPLSKTTKDELVWGLTRVRLIKDKQMVFTELKSHESYNLKTLDTTIYVCGSDAPIMRKDSLLINVRKFYEGSYLVKAEEIAKPFDTTALQIISFNRNFNNLSTADNEYIELRFSEITEFWIKQSNDKNNLGEFVLKSNEPGLRSEGIWGHSFNVLKSNGKYYEIKLVGLISGKIYETGIIEIGVK